MSMTQKMSMIFENFRKKKINRITRRIGLKKEQQKSESLSSLSSSSDNAEC
jgi:hypothetical protein